MKPKGTWREYTNSTSCFEVTVLDTLVRVTPDFTPEWISSPKNLTEQTFFTPFAQSQAHSPIVRLDECEHFKLRYFSCLAECSNAVLLWISQKVLFCSLISRWTLPLRHLHISYWSCGFVFVARLLQNIFCKPLFQSITLATGDMTG